MATEPGATASSATVAMPIIASADRSLDIVPYCQYLFSQELDKFMAVFPCEFPQGDRHTEEAFLRRFFSEDEIQVQGGSDGEGFRFLKQAWLWAAHWNINRRVPALAGWWVEHNQSILNDPDMKKRIFEPNVQPSTFFESKQIAMYGDKLLKVVIKHIQYVLLHPEALLADEGPPIGQSPDPVNDTTAVVKSASTVSVHHNAKGANNRNTDKQVDGQLPQGAQSQVNFSHAAPNGKAGRQHNDYSEKAAGNSHSVHNTLGSNGLASHSSNANRGVQVTEKPMYGPQDARYQSPVVQPSNRDTVLAAGLPPKPRTVSAGAYLPGQMEYPSQVPPGPQYEGQAPLMQSMSGLPTPYGFPINGNYQVQFQQSLPGPPNFPPGFMPHSPLPFGDRSNFPNDGRKLGNESRLYDPDEKSKPKQASNGGSLRGYKRGQPYIQRGNRGYPTFGQNGGSYSRDGRSFHRHSGSDFHFPMGAGQALQAQQFSIPQRENNWQTPYLADGNVMTTQTFGHLPYSNDGNLQPTPTTGSGAPPFPDSAVVLPPHIQYPPTGYGHQRVLSKSTPCFPTECNKYSIGEECQYAKKLVIFQVPLSMTTASFKEYFGTFGPVEEVHLSENHEESQHCPGFLQRRLSWVLFAHADSARKALHRRGTPWKGGPMLFAEVAGEYWDPEHVLYQVHRPAHGHPSSFAAATPSRGQTVTNNAPRKDSRTGDQMFISSGSGTLKKKHAANNKKPKKFNKKSTPGDENLEGEVKGDATRQSVQSQRATSIDGIPKAQPESAALPAAKLNGGDVTTAKKVWGGVSIMKNGETKFQAIEQTTDSEVPEKAVKMDEAGEAVDLHVDISSGLAISSVVVSEATLPSVEEEPEAKICAAPSAANCVADEATIEATSEEVTEATTIKPSDEQVDDSFHTADGLHEEKKDSLTSDHASVTCQKATVPEVCLEHKTWAEAATNATTASNVAVKNHESPSDGPVDTQVVSHTRSDLAAASQPQHSQSFAPTDHQAENAITKEDAGTPIPKQSLTITVPSIDTRIVSVGESEHGNEQSRSVSTTSIPGAPTSGFVTAPSTPAIPGPDMQVKSKKALKSKGPAQTESLSLFAKPKSRKSSSKKTKPSVEPSSRPGSVSIIRPIQGAEALAPHREGTIEPAAVVVNGANTSEVVKPAQESESRASAENPPETSGANGWKSVTNLMDIVVARVKSKSSAPQDIESSHEDRLPDAPADPKEPFVQPEELELDDPLPEASHLGIDHTAGLGISDSTAVSSSTTDRALSPGAESKPKKKKAKSKSKSKKPKEMAIADVSIVGHALVNTMPIEPPYEFKGNDVTSDSSSQTLGRTSPNTSPHNRPSMKRIDEANQPKALLEPRSLRQNRSKKHSSVHSNVQSTVNTSKPNRTDDTEGIVSETPGFTLIFPWVEGMYTVSDGRFVVLQWPNKIEQQAELEAKQKSDNSSQRLLMPMATPEMSSSVSKPAPMPEKPWEKDDLADSETSSPEAEKSKETLRQLGLEEVAQKRKSA